MMKIKSATLKLGEALKKIVMARRQGKEPLSNGKNQRHWE